MLHLLVDSTITKKMNKKISATKKSAVFLLKKQWEILHLWHIYNLQKYAYIR